MSPDRRVLVPIRDTVTIRETVTYAVRTVVSGFQEDDDGPGSEPDASGAVNAVSSPETATDPDGGRAIHLVYLSPWRDDDPGRGERQATARELLERARAWTEYDLEEAGVADRVTVETAIIGTGEYLFGTAEYAHRLLTYARTHGIDRIVVDPEHDPPGMTSLPHPLEHELSGADIAVETAPVERPARHQRLTHRATVGRFVSVFGLSFLFYLALGSPTYWYDVVTGAVTATIVAVLLSGIAFTHDPGIPRSPLRILRGVVYVPVLFGQILKANVEVAAVILDPRHDIEPRMTRMRTLVGGGLPLTTLANSITLTPGTLTVRARDQNLYVHSLLPASRDDLFDGGLERWVRFVFYGRVAARIPSPQERGDVALLQGDDADEPLYPEGRPRGRIGGDEE